MKILAVIPARYGSQRLPGKVMSQIGDRYNRAIYFSRASIPYFRNTLDILVFHHLGLYAFRQDFLSIYASLEPTPIELAEGLEQLRVIEHGFAIQVCPIKQALL